MKKENPVLSALISTLMMEKKPLWKRVARELSRVRRDRVEVNLSKLDAFAKEGSTVLVPGKVLGSGNINKKITVAAFNFSRTARQLITSAGGKTMNIDALLKTNPSGREVTIFK
jgi:large subunit ribosomal protein L18e